MEFIYLSTYNRSAQGYNFKVIFQGKMSLSMVFWLLLNKPVMALGVIEDPPKIRKDNEPEMFLFSIIWDIPCPASRFPPSRIWKTAEVLEV